MDATCQGTDCWTFCFRTTTSNEPLASAFCASSGRRLVLPDTGEYSEAVNTFCASKSISYDCTWIDLKCVAEDATCKDYGSISSAWNISFHKFQNNGGVLDGYNNGDEFCAHIWTSAKWGPGDCMAHSNFYRAMCLVSRPGS